MKVNEVMTQNPTCCTPDAALSEVAQMMLEKDCGCIPVVNNMTEMKPVGTLTDRDITIRSVAANQNPTAMKASEIMTKDISTVTPEMSLEECLQVMEDKEIRRVLVVDGQGKCCGIVAQADVVQSGINPVRTQRVIRDISESAPSPNQRTRMSGNRFNISKPSFMNSGSIVPLLIGLGSGIGLMYLINSRRSSARNDYDSYLDSDAYESDYLMEATNQKNFRRYTDAELEIERRQQYLEDRIHALREESNSPLSKSSELTNNEEETKSKRINGRTTDYGRF